MTQEGQEGQCRTCGQGVIATARSHAEALNECPFCEERRYFAERDRSPN